MILMINDDNDGDVNGNQSKNSIDDYSNDDDDEDDEDDANQGKQHH